MFAITKKNILKNFVYDEVSEKAQTKIKDSELTQILLNHKLNYLKC